MGEWVGAVQEVTGSVMVLAEQEEEDGSWVAVVQCLADGDDFHR